MTYLPVYQEWDILKESKELEPQKTEKYVSASSHEKPSFGTQMQKARIKKRMTVMDLAEHIKVSGRLISMYECGAENPTPDIVQKLTEVLELG